MLRSEEAPISKDKAPISRNEEASSLKKKDVQPTLDDEANVSLIYYLPIY